MPSESLAEFELLVMLASLGLGPDGVAAVRATTGVIRAMVGDLGDVIGETG